MRVLFMGTPDIAVPALLALAERHEVVGLFCQPDKPVGRKKTVMPPAAKVAALERGIAVFQPKTLRADEVYCQIEALCPDVIAVVAYGKLLPKRILDLPKYGSVNAHASLLPKYRGAAPVQYALLNGEEKTGVTVMQMNEGLDTGDILLAEEIGIAAGDDAVSLFPKVADCAAELLSAALERMTDGTLLPVSQNDAEATFAPPLTKEMAEFDFLEDARTIVNRVRAFAVWPVARFLCDGLPVKVFRAEYSPKRGNPGEVLEQNPLTVAAKDGAVALKEVMAAGKKRMPGMAYAAGQRLKTGDFIHCG